MAPGVFDHLGAVPAPHREPGEDHKGHFICLKSAEFLELTFRFDTHYNKLKSKKSKSLCSFLRRATHWLICSTSWVSAWWKQVPNWWNVNIISQNLQMDPSTAPVILLNRGPTSGGSSHWDVCTTAEKLLPGYQRRGSRCKGVPGFMKMDLWMPHQRECRFSSSLSL